MAADLGLVAHAAQRNADEFAPRGLGDRPTQRGFTHARRANEAQDRTFQLGRTVLHRQVFDDAFLDLFQTIVIGVQHFLGLGQILAGARLHAPRQAQQPVEVVAADRRFGRHRRHRLQLFQLGFGLFTGLLAELGRGDLFFQLGQLVRAILAIAQLLLNGLHLLIQIVFALRLLHLGLDARLDLLLDLKDGHFALHQAIDLLQPLGGVERLKQFLFLVQCNAQMAADQIGQTGRLARLGDRRDDLFGDVLAHLDVALELFGNGTGQRGAGVRIALDFSQGLATGLEILIIRHEAGDLHALAALDQHLDGAIGKFEQLQHIGQHAGQEDAVGCGFVHRRILLCRQQDRAILFHHGLQRPHGLFAPHEQRHDHVREHHDVP